jgi:pantoate--beta-alanine ligase
MQILRTIGETRQALRVAQSTGSLGLVPTMGALHEGHLSLVRRARSENDFVAASIFVNPLQFAPNEDLAKYPRTFEEDCRQLREAGVDFLFSPSPAEMYPAGATTTVDVGEVGTRLDGVARPGHFVGVATIVAKLFHILQPARAYFGQKDAAQLAVLRHMVRNLNFPVEMIACPIIRDADGLALSSRNRFLSERERELALVLPRTLVAICDKILHGVYNSSVLLEAQNSIRDTRPEIALDYLAIVDPDTLLAVPEVIPGTLIAIAATVGTTRLIDNLLAP